MVVSIDLNIPAACRSKPYAYVGEVVLFMYSWGAGWNGGGCGGWCGKMLVELVVFRHDRVTHNNIWACAHPPTCTETCALASSRHSSAHLFTNHTATAMTIDAVSNNTSGSAWLSCTSSTSLHVQGGMVL